jgi:hypothetical protein
MNHELRVFRLTESHALREVMTVPACTDLGHCRYRASSCNAAENSECHGNRCSERRTLLRGVNEVPPCFLNFYSEFLTEFGTSSTHGNILNDGELWENQSSKGHTLLVAVNAVFAHIFGITVGT